MHFEGLDLNLLVALDALLSEKNVTRAADRVCVSQPAMSASLQKLRLHLADPLLIRVGRSMELTPRAKSIAGSVKDLLSRVRNLLADEQNFDPAAASRICRIAMTSYCAEVFGVSLVHRLHQRAPNIGCQLEELTADAISRVYEGNVDFCVTLSDRAALDPSYTEDVSCEHFLFSDRFVLVGDRDNPDLSRPMTYDDFCGQPYVDVRISRDVVGLVEQELRRRGRRPSTIAWVSTFHAAMAMISNSRMVTIVPARLASLYADHFRLISRPAPLSLPDLHETAYWHPRSEADPGHLWIASLMREVAEELPPMDC